MPHCRAALLALALAPPVLDAAPPSALNATRRAAAFKARYGKSRGCGQDPPYNPTDPGQSLYQARYSISQNISRCLPRTVG
eukprot:SAG31_NODE_20737_length_566_cov_1.349036_1_plen_80_part_10